MFGQTNTAMVEVQSICVHTFSLFKDMVRLASMWRDTGTLPLSIWFELGLLSAFPCGKLSLDLMDGRDFSEFFTGFIGIGFYLSGLILFGSYSDCLKGLMVNVSSVADFFFWRRKVIQCLAPLWTNRERVSDYYWLNTTSYLLLLFELDPW